MELIHCKHCKYAVPVFMHHDDDSRELYAYKCRHNAPGLCGWPLVEITDFCGEAVLKG